MQGGRCHPEGWDFVKLWIACRGNCTVGAGVRILSNQEFVGYRILYIRQSLYQFAWRIALCTYEILLLCLTDTASRGQPHGGSLIVEVIRRG